MGLLNFKKAKRSIGKDKLSDKKKGTILTLSANRKKCRFNMNGKGSSMTDNSQLTSSTVESQMDVPVNVNVNVDKRDRRVRGLARGNQYSTFSLISMPSMKRGISQTLENPFLWDFDEDDYAAYNINDEIEEEPFDLEDSNHTHNANDDQDLYFAPVPENAPTLSTPTGTPTKRPSQATVTDLPAGDPAFAKPEVTRDLVRKFIIDIWNMGDIDAIPNVCSPKIRFNGVTDGLKKIGHDGLAMMVARVHEGLSDCHCEIHSMVVEGNKCFARVRYSGVHSGPFLGYPATGQRISWSAATEFTCQSGKILKVWELSDMKSLEDQLRAGTYEEMMKEHNNY